MFVKAKEGTRCPKEGKPREYIADDVAEDVPETAYYLRLVADGSLVAAGFSLRSQESGVQSSESEALDPEVSPQSAKSAKSADKKKGDNK